MPSSILISLGTNLGNRRLHLARAVDALRQAFSIVRLSRIIENAAVEAPAGSPPFLNMVAAGHTRLNPLDTLSVLQGIELCMGRRRGVRNAPRTIDLDLILHSANMMRTAALTLPHPRYLERPFVIDPLRELHLSWQDPRSGLWLREAIARADRRSGFIVEKARVG